MIQTYGADQDQADAAWNTRAALTAEISEGAVDGWQPIETAPKDDSLILVWKESTWADDPYMVVRWDDDWWQVHDGKTDRPLRGEEPTHWRPLPEPPATPVGAIAEGRE